MIHTWYSYRYEIELPRRARQENEGAALIVQDTRHAADVRRVYLFRTGIRYPSSKRVRMSWSTIRACQADLEHASREPRIDDFATHCSRSDDVVWYILGMIPGIWYEYQSV